VSSVHPSPIFDGYLLLILLDPIKNWGRVKIRHTENIGDQVKNKQKE
jgi:hypothetical protein